LEDLLAIIETSLMSGTSDRPRIKNVQDLLDDDSVVIPDQVVTGVIHRGTKTAMGGASKTFKTFTCLYLAECVSYGIPFFGCKTTQGSVLYINLEIGEPWIKERIKNVRRKMVLPEKNRNMDVWTMRGWATTLSELIPDIIRAGRSRNYSLIIIDPIYKTLTGKDEIGTEEIGKLCSQLDTLAMRTGAAVLYVCHYSKGNQANREAIDRISGSGLWGRDADTLINFTAHKQRNCFAVEFKLRNFPEMDPFTAEWQYPIMIERKDLDPGDLKKTNQAGKTVIAMGAVFKLVPGGDEPAILQNDLIRRCQELGATVPAAKVLINALLAEGQIYKVEIPRSRTRPAIAYKRNSTASGFDTGPDSVDLDQNNGDLGRENESA
jgi:hypothetical protein